MRTRHTTNTAIQTKEKKWITFTYHNPLILVHKVTNLFKNTNLHTAFRANNTIFSHLYHQSSHNKLNASGIYRLQCTTCKKSYVSQTGRSLAVRHREHIIYIKNNNPLSAYSMHVLNNKHYYGNPEHTLQLLQACEKGKIINCWESLHIQIRQQQQLLIDEQRTYDFNSLYSLANKTHHTTQFHNRSVGTEQAQP